MIRDKLLNNILWNTLGGAGAKLIAPLFQIAIARILSPSDYGYFAVVIAIVYLYDMVKDLGFTDSIVANFRSNQQVSAQFSVQFITSTVSIALLAAIHQYAASSQLIDPQITEMLLFTLVVIAINPIADSYTTFHRIHQNYQIIANRQLLFGLVSGCSGLLLALNGFGVYALLFGFILGHLLALVYLWYCTRELALRLDLTGFRLLFDSGKHIVVQRLSGYLVSHGDALIIAKFLGPQSLGLYRMAHQLVNILPTATFLYSNQVLFTEFAQRIRTGDFAYVESVYRKYTLLAGLGLLVFSVLVVFFSPFVIELILGPQWLSLPQYVGLLSAGLATSYMSLPNRDLARILGFTHVFTVYSIGRGVFTFCMVFVGAQWGIKEAVLGWLIAGVLANIVSEIIFHGRQSKISLVKIKVPLFAINIAWLVTLGFYF